MSKINFADLFAVATKAVETIKEGREALDNVRDAIADGKAAFDTNQLDQLSNLLDTELDESRAASAGLQSAIADAKANL